MHFYLFIYLFYHLMFSALGFDQNSWKTPKIPFDILLHSMLLFYLFLSGAQLNWRVLSRQVQEY